MHYTSQQYLNMCNLYLKAGQITKSEGFLDKAFEIDENNPILWLKKSEMPKTFNNIVDNRHRNKFIDIYIEKSIENIEDYIKSIESKDSLSPLSEWKLLKYLDNLNKLYLKCRTANQCALVFKYIADIYLLLSDSLQAFKFYKKSLYFIKSPQIKKSYKMLAKDFGKNDEIYENDFNYKLLNNIYFKSISSGVCNEDVKDSNSLKKYLINGKLGYVEDVAIDYYNKKGFNAFHSENYFWHFNSEVFFRDIDEDYCWNHEDINHYRKNLYARFYECEKVPFKQFLKKYYYSNKYLEYHDGIFSSKYDRYYTDYVEFDGYDVWVERLDAISIEKCLKLLLELKLNSIGRRLPFSGLPDLFVYKEKQCFFVEVKSTNDRLSFKQKWWHMFISEELNIPIVIFMVNKNEKQIKSIKRQYLIK